MASIIQILIHLKLFLEQFYKSYNCNTNSLYIIFLNFIDKISNSNNAIDIKDFADKYNQINHKFAGDKGNNPMTFLIEFIKKLSEETNENILNLFSGKKYIKFEGMSDLNYEEDFIILLTTLNENKYLLYDSIYEEKEFEDDENLKIVEEIKVKPEILVINLEIEDIEYNFEEKIIIDGNKYFLKAINRYTNFHSTA